MKYIFLLPIFLLSAISIAQNCPSGNERVTSINKKFEKEVLRLTNIERTKRGLSKLEWNEQLSFAARYHAKDMAEDDYFEHDSFNRKKSGKLIQSCNIFERIEAFANFSSLAENISAGRQTPKDVVEAWMKSAGHRKNILTKDYNKLGVGYYYNEDSEYNTYWVQNFGGD